jgi:DNA replication protein DnaC
MIEAQSQLQLTKVRNRWMRYELIVVDELGYVVMPDAAAELLFQVIAGRAEQAAIIVTPTCTSRGRFRKRKFEHGKKIDIQ